VAHLAGLPRQQEADGEGDGDQHQRDEQGVLGGQHVSAGGRRGDRTAVLEPMVAKNSVARAATPDRGAELLERLEQSRGRADLVVLDLAMMMLNSGRRSCPCRAVDDHARTSCSQPMSLAA
jgi:hypothetical protein